MRVLFRYIHTFTISICFILSSCSSSPSVSAVNEVNEPEIPKFISKQESSLSDILEHPQLYIDRTITISGLVQSTDIRKVTKHLSLLTVKISEGQGEVQLDSKFHFLEKLREAEDLVSENRYKNIRLSSASAKRFYENACDLKIASSRLEALSHYYNGMGKGEIAQSMLNLSSGYSYLGDSYISFQKAALASSPAVENLQKGDLKMQVSKFEESLLRASGLMLVFAHELEKTKDLIASGYYSFNSKVNLNKNRSFEILTYGSLLKAEAWKQQKAGNDEFFSVSKVLSKAVTDFGKGDKKINDALTALSESLNKTAIISPRESLGSLKCAYYGFNRSHLNRCLNSVNRLDKDVKVKVSGTLRRSNLREEVDVLWLHARQFEIDGVKIALNYGDESGTMRSAMDLYEWAESVEKGK